MIIEHEPCSSTPNHISEPRPVSMENKPYPQDIQPALQPTPQTPNTNPIPTSKSPKKIHMTDPCTKVSYHKPTPKTSTYKTYPIQISMIKYIEIDNLISLILIQPLSSIAVNALGSDSIKLSTSKILNYYKDLSEIFSKKESKSLSPHRDHLDHHISLEKDVKSIFGLIYNLFELEFKVLKEYI